MNATRSLHDLGQNPWFDNITRPLLDSGTLARHMRDFAVTGRMPNPKIFEQAIRYSEPYEEAIRRVAHADQSGETQFFALVLENLRRAADLFRPAFEASGGADDWVSLEVSPLLARDAAGTPANADLHARAAPQCVHQNSGPPEVLAPIQASIFAGVPINVTLLLSYAQSQADAEAYLHGIECRLASGLYHKVYSVALLLVSRWDVAANPRLCQSQRLLWASPGNKGPRAQDTLYIDALAAPDTLNTMSENTLQAFVVCGQIQPALASAQATATPPASSQAGGGQACARRAPAARRRGRIHRLLAPCSMTSRPRRPRSHR